MPFLEPFYRVKSQNFYLKNWISYIFDAEENLYKSLYFFTR